MTTAEILRLSHAAVSAAQCCSMLAAVSNDNRNRNRVDTPNAVADRIGSRRHSFIMACMACERAKSAGS